MIEILQCVATVLLLYLVISLFWRGAEKLIYDHVTPRYIDDIVALTLAF